MNVEFEFTPPKHKKPTTPLHHNTCYKQVTEFGTTFMRAEETFAGVQLDIIDVDTNGNYAVRTAIPTKPVAQGTWDAIPFYIFHQEWGRAVESLANRYNI